MERADGYAPIRDYGLLGDGQGCALVCRDGSIDWLAVPRIDTPPLLAGILDADHGGSFSVTPTVDYRSCRSYVAGTMVLQTTFETDDGIVEVTDSMNLGFRGILPWTELARSIRGVEGRVPLRWELRPGTRLSTVRPWAHLRGETPFVLAGDLLAALILDEAGEPQVDTRCVSASMTVEEGQSALITLVVSQDMPLYLSSPDDVRRRLDNTVRFWKDWSDLIDFEGPHAYDLRRSLLVLKALANSRTGALAAAPTTSLPEVIGKDRNYDYRYGWVRDSSFMLDAFASVQLTEEVNASIDWLLRGVSRTAPDVHVFYKLDSEPASGQQQEVEDTHGYQGSRPVTVGNKAAEQRQIGSYGDLFGAIARHVRQGAHLDTNTGLKLAKLADQLCDEWPLPGAGLWELGEQRRYTSSLIASWSALHLAAELVESGQIPDTHVERWREAAEEVRAWTDSHCWSDTKGSYTFYAGTEDLDAAVLLAARTGYLEGGDPRLWSTIDAIRRELSAGGPWLYRYSGADKQEHAFVCCTFWLIEALACAGRITEARELLDGALRGANDLKLWAEEIDAHSGSLLGNFPLGLSHLSVVGAIIACSKGGPDQPDSSP